MFPEPGENSQIPGSRNTVHKRSENGLREELSLYARI